VMDGSITHRSTRSRLEKLPSCRVWYDYAGFAEGAPLLHSYRENQLWCNMPSRLLPVTPVDEGLMRS